MFKINCDASELQNNFVLAVVCRNSDGRLVTAHSGWKWRSNSLKAEALAGRLAMLVAGEYGWDHVILKGDGQVLFSQINNAEVLADWIIEEDGQLFRTHALAHPN